MRKPPFEVSEPQRYIADEGYFFHVLWHPKKFPQPFYLRCHADSLEAVPEIANAAKDSMVKYLLVVRDELNKARWLDEQESGKKKRGI